MNCNWLCCTGTIGPDWLLTPRQSLLCTMERAARILRSVWENISIEPLVILYTLIETMSEISGEELYLQKACKVNFNQSSQICYNLDQHQELEVEIQKYVVGLKVGTWCLAILSNLPLPRPRVVCCRVCLSFSSHSLQVLFLITMAGRCFSSFPSLVTSFSTLCTLSTLSGFIISRKVLHGDF